MSKVKKAAGVTGERNIKGTDRSKRKSAAPKRKGGGTKASSRSHGGRTEKSPARKTSRKTARGKAAKASQAARGKARDKANSSRPMRKGKTRGPTKKGRLAVVRGGTRVKDGPVVTVTIKELDPLRKCGPNTSVQFLYRVDESVDGRRTAHLVFFDRHGWYCEHGRTCPAVGHARKFNGQIARVS